MAATVVSTASLPRRASPTASDHRPKSPSLRKRHCAVRPVAASANPTRRPTANEESAGRRQVFVAGAAAAAALLSRPNPAAFAAEAKKVFLPVTDKKTGYSFLYPSGWQNDVYGRAYYTFEFTAQAPNYTRHALGTIAIANGKFYTLTTGANERRWEKMEDGLHTVVDSFKIDNRI